MAKADPSPVAMRIVVDHPVIGVSYSLQDKDGGPFDPKRSETGEPLIFDFAIRVGPGPKFFGDHVRREGPERRFVYLRVGELAGDVGSPWSRRIKLDIHDLDAALLAGGIDGGTIETVIDGTGADGTPACATLRPMARRLV